MNQEHLYLHWSVWSQGAEGAASRPSSTHQRPQEQKQWQKIWGWRLILGRESWRSFLTVWNPLTGLSVGSFRISEDNITGREKTVQNTKLTMYTMVSNCGLGREAQAASSLGEGSWCEKATQTMRSPERQERKTKYNHNSLFLPECVFWKRNVKGQSDGTCLAYLLFSSLLDYPCPCAMVATVKLPPTTGNPSLWDHD